MYDLFYPALSPLSPLFPPYLLFVSYTMVRIF